MQGRPTAGCEVTVQDAVDEQIANEDVEDGVGLDGEYDLRPRASSLLRQRRVKVHTVVCSPPSPQCIRGTTGTRGKSSDQGVCTQR